MACQSPFWSRKRPSDRSGAERLVARFDKQLEKLKKRKAFSGKGKSK
jgi:hypothetical protein